MHYNHVVEAVFVYETLTIQSVRIHNFSCFQTKFHCAPYLHSSITQLAQHQPTASVSSPIGQLLQLSHTHSPISHRQPLQQVEATCQCAEAATTTNLLNDSIKQKDSLGVRRDRPVHQQSPGRSVSRSSPPGCCSQSEVRPLRGRRHTHLSAFLPAQLESDTVKQAVS